MHGHKEAVWSGKDESVKQRIAAKFGKIEKRYKCSRPSVQKAKRKN